MFYDKDAVIIDPERWGELHSDESYMRVGKTTVIDGSDPGTAWSVSTVWLGVDHGFGRSHVPVLFETMVFDDSGDAVDEWSVRYCTEGEALRGHTDTVVRLSAGLSDPIVRDSK